MDNAKRRAPGARVDGVIVQKMAGRDVELVVGLQNDPVFGPAVMLAGPDDAVAVDWLMITR